MLLLDELNEVLREFAETSSDGTLVYCIDTQRMTYVSPVGREITGLATGSGLKDIKEAFDRVAKEDQPYLKQVWARLVSGQQSAEIEFKVYAEDRSLFYILCTSIHVLKDNRFIFVQTKDITKAKEHENYLLEFGAKKNTTLDSVVHFVSGAMSLTQHLSSEARRSADARADNDLGVYLNLINENTAQCLKVVEDLMKQEHLKSPAIAVKKVRSDINEKVNYIVERLRVAYQGRTINFSSTHASIIVPVDEMKLLQIVNNLLSNAFKFSEPHEPVDVHIGDLDETAVIRITDKGVGIPAELQPFIFDKNSSARRTGLRGEKSNGIGLSICQILAQLMNGRIWFESATNKGSTFYLSLPK